MNYVKELTKIGKKAEYLERIIVCCDERIETLTERLKIQIENNSNVGRFTYGKLFAYKHILELARGRGYKELSDNRECND